MNRPADPDLPNSPGGGGRHFVQLLADLLADPRVRDELVHSPQELFARYELTLAEQRSLEAVNIQQLEEQAQSLIRKRWHAVARLIPDTIGSGPQQEMRSLFEFYATRHWPGDFRRHWLDAHEFLRFLDANDLPYANAGEKKKLSRMFD